MDRTYNFVMYFVGFVCILVIALFFGAFDALHISAPAVFASLGAFAILAISVLGHMELRKRFGRFRDLKAATFVVGIWLLFVLVIWLCDYMIRGILF